MTFKELLKKYYILSLAILPLLSLAMVTIATGILAVGSIFCFRKNKINFIFHDNKANLKMLFWYSLPFPLLILSLLWTEDFRSGFSIIVKSLSFIVIPAIIFILKPFKSKKQIETFFKTYIISSAIFVIIVLDYIIINIVFGDLSYDSSNYMATVQLRSQFDKIPIINEHPIYFSLLAGVALILLFYNKFKQTWFNVVIIFILVTGILIASSRGPILALFLVFLCVLYLNVKNRLKAICAIMLFIVFGLLMICFSPLKSRLKEVVNTKYIYPEGIHHNSFNIRMGIYKCSLELIKETPLYGYGPGDVQSKLDQCYIESFKTEAYQKTSYNSHNQYLYYWLSFGLVGFILLIFSYVIYVRESLKFRNEEYGMFLMFFLIAFLTENVLNRNTGIVLFTMLNCLLYYKNLLANDSN